MDAAKGGWETKANCRRAGDAGDGVGVDEMKG